MNIKVAVLAALCAGSCANCYGHDDLDLGIESVRLNTQCKVEIVIKNYGHDLPESFYQTINPAFLTIKKGDREETLHSLRALDKRRQLEKFGGSLKITSTETYAKMPSAITVAIEYAEEFGDYGGGNDRHIASMDCIAGRGQIEGAPIVYTQPDVAVVNARIDPQTCKMAIELENLTGIPLAKDSWLQEGGVGIMRLNLQTQTLAPEIPLVNLDPEKTFGEKGKRLSWETALPFTDAKSLRVGVWRVRDDLDFSNNTMELAVPNACETSKKEP